MLSIRARFFATALALVFAGSTSGFAAEGDATEALLKAAKFDYKVLKPGIFRVVFETPEGVSVLIVEESKMGWKDSKGVDVLSVVVMTQCYVTPADYKPTSAVLTWTSETNGNLKFGSINSYKDNDGATHFLRNGSLFLQNLEMEQFVNLAAICHYQKFEIAKKLKALVEATN